MLKITDHIFIDESELTESFIRASGPGGQNVNKTSSAVQLRFNIGKTTALNESVKARTRILAGNRLSKEDAIIIEASTHRTQKANRIDARQRLAQLLRAAVPPPVKRKHTRPTKASIKRRLLAKKQRGLIKASRSRIKNNLE